MKLDTKCVMCNRLDEDGGHLFFKCKQVRWLWGELQMESTRADMMSAESVKEVEKILKLKTEIQRSVIIYCYISGGVKGVLCEKERGRGVLYR